MIGIVLLAALDLGTLFAQKDSWAVKAERFAADHAKAGFVFASEDHDIVNCLRHDTCTWNELQVWETKVYFEKSGADESISRVEISLYNRGDAGGKTISQAGLQSLVDKVTKVFVPDERRAPAPEKMTLKNGGQQFRRAFVKSDPSAELVWGLSAGDGAKNRTVEYLRLTLARKGALKAKMDSMAKRAAGAAGKAKIKSNVTKTPEGDVYIDNVPMVDQGQKGYCAAAVSERVLRYFGNQIDEHEIAQQAGTSADGGTSVSAMKAVVSTVGAKNGLGYQTIVSMTEGGDLGEDISRYNKIAKIEKKPTLSLSQFMRGNAIDGNAIRTAMDPKVVRIMRTKDPRFKRFSAGVRQQVNAGIPVFWGVTLGMYPEPKLNPQTAGGHMRLIIGYNDKKKEILYTDTWGEGHELKRMPEDNAFAMTHDAFALKPR